MDRFRVLALDDDPDTLELVRMTLKDEYDILTLANPMEIYEYLELFEPDLLILDIMMPKITGFQIIELMSKNASFRAIPILVLSAKDSVREIKYGYKLGVRMYLTKPFQTERLMKNVKMILSEIATRRKKTLTAQQVMAQIQIRSSYKMGQTAFSGDIYKNVTQPVQLTTNTTIMPKIPKMTYKIPDAKNLQPPIQQPVHPAPQPQPPQTALPASQQPPQINGSSLKFGQLAQSSGHIPFNPSTTQSPLNHGAHGIMPAQQQQSMEHTQDNPPVNYVDESKVETVELSPEENKYKINKVPAPAPKTQKEEPEKDKDTQWVD